MKVLVYARVSTSKQAQDGVSLDMQEEKGRQWAVLYDAELVGVYRDEGVSAKNLRRPGLGQMVQDAEALRTQGKEVTVVVYNLSRLTRSLRDLQDLVDWVTKTGVCLVSLCESLDTATVNGRMVLNILMSVLQAQREKIGEDTREAMAAMKANGRYTGGHVPYGYRLRADGKFLEAEPQEQQVIHLVRDLHGQGRSLRSIAAALNNNRVLSRSGVAWTHTTIKPLLVA